MGLLGNVAQGIRSLFRSRTIEREMDDELCGFVEASTAEKLRRGIPADQAARAARVEMGSANAVKHQIRSAGWESKIEILWQDLRYAVRTLFRSPGFTLIAVLSLALGIGANTAIFTLIKQVLLQNLPVHDPQQLVTFGKSMTGGMLGGIDLGTADMFTYDFARQLESKPGPFEGVAAYSSGSPKVSVRTAEMGAPIQVRASIVSGNYFSVLGATAILGRTLFPSDAAAPNQTPVAVISHRFWLQSLSADPAIVGRTIAINGAPFTVVGVMGKGFNGIRQDLDPPDLWAPITMASQIYLQPSLLEPRGMYFLHMFARRNPRFSLGYDQTWLDRQIRDYVRTGEGQTISADRQHEIERLTVQLIPGAHGVAVLRKQYGDSLMILMAVVAVVLLIACANLANFLLARSVNRQRENATRLALGSTRGRIVLQSLTESLLLALAGGTLGLLLAFVAARALIAFVAQGAANVPLASRPDATVLLFTLGISLLTAVLFGVAPAVGAVRNSATPALSANARTLAASGGTGMHFWPRALVIGQVALSVLLLVSGGLFLRTLHNLQDQDFGFERTHMLIAEFDARIAGYKPEQAPALNQRLLERLSAIPSVRAAALSTTPPISSSAWTSTMSISGYTPRPKEDMSAVLNGVSGDYFNAAGISLAAGRLIQPSDNPSTLKVAVINQSLARHFFPKGDAIGHTLKIDIEEPGPWEIVGIARDTKSLGPREDAKPTVSLPLAQITGSKGEGVQNSYAWVIVLRTSGDPVLATAGLRNAVRSVDPNLPVLRVRTIREQLETFMGQEMLISRLTAVFACLAVLLAGVGLYGVMNFSVIRRRNEIGIRIALGATSGGVQWMVLRESFVLLLTGLVLGVPLAMATARFIRAQLFQMSSFDPLIFTASIIGISAVTVVSAWLPARRAAAVDPMAALRCE